MERIEIENTAPNLTDYEGKKIVPSVDLAPFRGKFVVKRELENEVPKLNESLDAMETQPDREE